jgi:hypothetical protein
MIYSVIYLQELLTIGNRKYCCQYKFQSDLCLKNYLWYTVKDMIYNFGVCIWYHPRVY